MVIARHACSVGLVAGIAELPTIAMHPLIAVLEECYRDLAGPVLARGAVLRLPISAGLLVQLGVRHLALPVVADDED